MVGAGFIVRDCHLVAYDEAGFRVVGITSRTLDRAREVAELRGIPRVYAELEALLDDPEVEVVDIAVPPADQPGIIERVLAHPPQGPRDPGAEAAGAVDGRSTPPGRRLRESGRGAAGQSEHAVRPVGAGGQKL